MNQNNHTIIFWGAGATAHLGIKSTEQQKDFLWKLAYPENDQENLEFRIEYAKVNKRFSKPLHDLLLILGDNAKDTYNITDEVIEAIRRNWRNDATESELKNQIHELRSVYDWQTLREVIKICPASGANKNFNLTDVFNVLDMYIQSGHGFKVNNKFATTQALLGAKNALYLLLQTCIYIDYHNTLENQENDLNNYYEFAKEIARRMQRQGLSMQNQPECFGKREFYMGDVSFVSLNYDPIGLWTQFIANHDLNNSASVPHIGCPAEPLKIFHDFSHFMAVKTINQSDDSVKEKLWFPMNEAAAQRINDIEYNTGRKVRLTKYLFPHGCMCWRECPNCGQLTAYFGSKWNLTSTDLIPPPPLKSFVHSPDNNHDGRVDGRKCVHCNEMTYAHHTQTIMQSNFKQSPPSFIEEIQRSLRVEIEKSNHIILMGYSLPSDDVTYRALFAARKKRQGQNDKEVKCSVVVGYQSEDKWIRGEKDLDHLLEHHENKGTINAAIDIFGKENVRYYGCGIPNVFLENGSVSEKRVNTLLNWEESF
jgi:hypothetical protein